MQGDTLRYIVKLWHLHRFRFEPTLITIGCSGKECAIDPAMDPMGRRQHSPSWAWDWCFCCRSSSWPVPSWLLIVHRVQWLMPQVKVHSLALSKAWFSILAFSCAKLSLGLRVDALVHSVIRAYWNGASTFGLKKFWRSARSIFRYIIVITYNYVSIMTGNVGPHELWRSNKSLMWQDSSSANERPVHLIFWAILRSLGRQTKLLMLQSQKAHFDKMGDWV